MVEKTGSGSRFIAVLSNTRFMLLWLGQVTSQTADRIFVYVMMIVIYSLTQSYFAAALPHLAFGIPSVLFAAFAGVYVDKLDRKGVLLVSNLVRGLLVLFVIPLASKSVLLMFLIALLIYTATQFFAPAETSVIPDFVDRKHLIVANSLFMVTLMASMVVGFGLGAPLMKWFNINGTFVISASLYFISAAAILLIPFKFHERLVKKDTHVIQDLREGFEFIRQNQVIQFSLLKLFVATAAIAVLSVLAIGYAKDVLQIGKENFGYLILVVGAGMFVGMALLERLTHFIKKGTLVVVSFICSGIVLLAMSVVNDLNPALVLIFLLGVGNVFITTSIHTIMQHRIPREIRGRVFGVQNMIINSAFTFPVLLFGLIADRLRIPFALAILGWVVLGMGIFGVFLPKFKEV